MIREDAEVDGFLAGLVDRYAPSSPEFLVVTTKGDYFKFRHVSGHDELVGLRKGARDFLAMMAASLYPEPWREFASADRDTLIYTFHMARLNVEWGTVVRPEGGEPAYERKGRLGELAVLQIASRAPHLFDALKMALDEKMHVAAVTFDADGVLAAEKKSPPTGSTESGSQPVAPSGEDTPTS